MRRHPGLGAALACLVILVVVMNFLVNGPETAKSRTAGNGRISPRGAGDVERETPYSSAIFAQ